MRSIPQFVYRHLSPALAFVVLLALPALPAHATIIVGGNLANQTWTLAGSPYIIQGDVTVVAGAFLTINAGVDVQVALTDGQAAGLDTARVEITVNGSLNVNGTIAQPVTFRAQSGTANNSWYGMVLNGGATAVNISNASIRHAVFGISSSVSGSVLQSSRAVISSCTTGVSVVSGWPTVDAFSISACATAMRLEGSASPTVQNCVIFNNTQYGVYCDNPSLGAVNISGCTLDNNPIGISAVGGLAPVNITNNIISNGSNTGIQRVSPANVNATYNDVWNNVTNYSGGVAAGAGSISANPLYAGPTDYSLTAASPCIDSGTITNCPSTDYLGTARPQDGNGIGGGQCDIGAYEYVIICNGAAISTPPSNTSGRVGQTVTMSVQATGSAPLVYHWRRNTVNLSDNAHFWGTQSANLLIYPVALADAGSYDVVVSNACSNMTSTAATLAVQNACFADIAPPGGNGMVNIDDLLAVINGWGSCP